MIGYESGQLARSLAGHDKGRLYIILEESGEYVSLTDGKTRTVKQPKRKNKKHVQIQASTDKELLYRFKRGEAVGDEEIRNSLSRQAQLLQQGGNRRNVESRCD